MTKRPNRIFAMPAAPAAIPVNPNRPAINDKTAKMIAYFSILKLLVLSGPKLALRKHRTCTVHIQVSGSLLKRRRKKAYILNRSKLGMVGSVLGIALLLSSCATSPPMDEAKVWVDRLSPACES